MKVELIVIENDADLAEAHKLLDSLMAGADEGAASRLRAQARLIEDYERRRWPRNVPSVPQLLLYLMEQHDMTRADLVPVIGSPGRVSEVMNGKVGLSMTMVRRLRERFDVPADLLIQAGDRRAAAAA
jgi:HTH-type transcriptional regulator/antitoxin HigA